MGSVYRARDTRLGREVAVKLLSEAAASQSSAAERFMREALAASALNHPNIITVYEYTDSEFGPILVTELIEGKTLRQLIPERPSLEARARLVQANGASIDCRSRFRNCPPRSEAG